MRNHLIATLAVAAAASLASAADVFDNFEGPPPAGFDRTFGTDGSGTAGLSTAGQPSQGTTSVRISLPNVAPDYGVVSLTSNVANQPIGKLRDMSMTFDAYVDASSTFQGSLPYGQFGLDSNGDGTFDPNSETLIIAFSSSNAFATNTWVTESLTGANAVHVVVDRGSLPSGTDNDFLPDATPDYLNELYDISYNGGATLWGDLDVYRVRVAAGFFNSPGQNYLAYVDNISAAPVPEPLAVGGVAGLGLIALRRRRASM